MKYIPYSMIWLLPLWFINFDIQCNVNAVMTNINNKPLLIPKSVQMYFGTDNTLPGQYINT